MGVIYSEKNCRLQDPNVKPKQCTSEKHQLQQGKREMERIQRFDSLQNERRWTPAQAAEVMLSIKFNRRTRKYYCWQSSSVPSKPINYKGAECIRWNERHYLCCTQGLMCVCCLHRTLGSWTAFYGLRTAMTREPPWNNQLCVCPPCDNLSDWFSPSPWNSGQADERENYLYVDSQNISVRLA